LSKLFLTIAAAFAEAEFDRKRIIAERFGVDFHPRNAGKLLQRLGFTHISARHRHPAQDERIVEVFKKTFRGR
jgi:transposase